MTFIGPEGDALCLEVQSGISVRYIDVDFKDVMCWKLHMSYVCSGTGAADFFEKVLTFEWVCAVIHIGIRERICVRAFPFNS